jgi:putative PIN family toxin of toxin-antitoxin system
MKVLFDTNVYVAEALLGAGAEEMVAATVTASWRIFVSDYLLDECQRVLTDKLGFSTRLAALTRLRIVRRSEMVRPTFSRHGVPDDPADSPILRAALSASVDYLVTNDRHLLDLNPQQCVRIISMADYRELLIHEGLLNSPL